MYKLLDILSEIKLKGMNQISPEDIYKLSTKINYKVFKKKIYEMGWDGINVLNFIDSLPKDKLAKLYLYVLQYGLKK